MFAPLLHMKVPEIRCLKILAKASPMSVNSNFPHRIGQHMKMCLYEKLVRAHAIPTLLPVTPMHMNYYPRSLTYRPHTVRSVCHHLPLTILETG